MISQLLQTSLLLAVIVLFYKVLLEKETHHRLNRWVLLSCMVLVCALPYVKVQVLLPDFWPSQTAATSEHPPIALPQQGLEDNYIPWEGVPTSAPDWEENTPIVQEHTEHKLSSFISQVSWPKALIYTYLLGFIVMALHLGVQLWSLFQLVRTLPSQKEGKYTIVELPSGKASYSFFNYIFINASQLNQATYEQILSHEKIHVDQRHSFDILLSQLLIIVLWFNPLAWLYKKKVKENLEYLTDDIMVQKGNDKKMYQFSLLRASTSHRHPNIVLNYSQSLLKKRILMMNSQKSSLFTAWKYLFLLPILGSSVLSFGAKETPEPVVTQSVFVAPQQEDDFTPPPNIEDAQIWSEPVQQETSPATLATPLPLPEEFSNVAIGGTWEAMVDGDEVCLRITRSLTKKGWNWMNHDCYEKSDFIPSNIQANTEFRLQKKAGTLTFTGSFDGNKGEGKFSFSGSSSYEAELKRKGVLQVHEDLLFRLFFMRDEKKFLDNLLAIQNLGVRGETLDKLSASMVDAKLVQKYQEEGLSLSEHVDFLTSRVGPKLLKEYQAAGFDLDKHRGFINSRVKPSLLTEYEEEGLDLEQHRGFINSRVKPKLLKEYQNAGFDVKEYKSFINSRVEPKLLKAYQSAGFDVDEHRSFVNSRVKPELLKEYQDAGFDVKEYRSFINSRVEPKLLKTYQSAGFDVDEHRSFVNSRVKPELLKEYQDAGFDITDYRSFINSRVSPELLKDYRNAGFDVKEYRSFINSRIKPELLKDYQKVGLSLEDHRSFINSRVKPGFLKEYQDAGFDLKEYRSYINSRVSPEFLKKYKAAGFSLEEHRGFINSRVDPGFLQRYEKAGYPVKEHRDFINRRISPEFLKKYEAAGLAIDEHREFILDHVNPQTVLKYRNSQRKNGEN